MITVKKAITIINNTKFKISSEYIKTEESLGRVTSSNIKSGIDNPSFDMSAMDGYAVSDNPINRTFKIVGKSFAGKPLNRKLYKGEAIRVFTGSKIPDNTKAVIIQENVQKINKYLILHKNNKIEDGNFIRKKGFDFKKNKIILKKNKVINARDVGLLVSANSEKIKVYKKPTVSLIASGDELIVNNSQKKEGSVYASSMLMLESLIKLSNASCNNKSIVKDNKKKIINELIKSTKSDVIITTGGVSVGDRDLIRSSLDEIGFDEKFWRVKMRPGKPLLFGLLKGKPVFSLPGNPVSSYVCFYLFVKPFLNKLLNIESKTTTIKAKLSKNLNIINQRETYLRGFYFYKKDEVMVKPLPNQDSSLLKALANSNCLIKLPISKEPRKKNNTVEIIIISNLC